LALNLLVAQAAIAVHVLASEQAVQVVLATVGHPASHPSVASLLVLNLLASQVTAVHPSATAELHAVQVPSLTAAHETSQPLLASLSALPLPDVQVTAVHPLAMAVVQAVQVPPVTVAQAKALSHPSATLPLLSNLPDVQVTAVHPLATAEVQAVHVPSATVAQQLKSSLFDVVANWFDGHVEHAFASTKGFNSGFDM